MRPIIFADNQEITRLGLQTICEPMANTTPHLYAENRQQLIQQLSAHPMAVVVLDYTLFDFTSIDSFLALQLRFENVDWVLFCDHLSDYTLIRLVDNTRVSIVLKDSPIVEIEAGIESALSGQRFICNSINLLIHNNLEKEKQTLTPTEKEIVKLIAQGKSNKEIAADSCTSVHTVATHRKNIFRKLDVNNAYELVKYALRAGLVDSTDYYI
ncbi:helix-turn-helix transcriptional regulator [Bacteroidia bacterium]|nr:helix-turn-helix transcriptional regulator [Bacteroidia bacterium]